eukprot:686292-Prorocentrum_minimum.AAC.1
MFPEGQLGMPHGEHGPISVTVAADSWLAVGLASVGLFFLYRTARANPGYICSSERGVIGVSHAVLRELELAKTLTKRGIFAGAIRRQKGELELESAKTLVKRNADICRAA